MRDMKRIALKAVLIAPFLAALPGSAVYAAESRPGLKPCRLQGIEHEALCGVLQRPLDAAQPGGKQIDIHYAVLPALARNRLPDPVMFFAGGPGQSAIDLAGSVARLLTRLAYRRDIILIDQRGTGRSAPLLCPEIAQTAPLAQVVDTRAQRQRLQDCLMGLKKLPHGDLRFYTTTLAMQDADAVRQALGVEKLNLVGGSYGTRAALEYMRLFPTHVRRAVIDGVAPPDMVLPAAMSLDTQAAFDAVLAACQAQAPCQRDFPSLSSDWKSLLAGLPREVSVAHPLTGSVERLRLTREMVLSLVRGPLYAPALAAGLPLAVSEAAKGRYEPLFGLSAALSGRVTGKMSEGMHFSVICAEDGPRIGSAGDAPGADFGDATLDLYRSTCAEWPRGEVPAAFYEMPAARAATLVLSGGADPVTPPRHGERAARALGALARHVLVPQAGHGVMGLPCMRDVMLRYFAADTDTLALQVDAGCASQVPRPPALLPFNAGAAR